MATKKPKPIKGLQAPPEEVPKIVRALTIVKFENGMVQLQQETKANDKTYDVSEVPLDELFGMFELIKFATLMNPIVPANGS